MAVATLKQMSDRIKSIVQDTSYDSYVTDYINEVIEEVCEDIYFPALMTSITVTTSIIADNVSLPTDYHRGLYRVYSTANGSSNINILGHDELIHRYHSDPDANGQVCCVAIKAGKLYYRYIPSVADTLTLYYHKKVSTLSSDSDQPTCFGTNHESIAKSCIIHGVCMKIFDQIEDGIGGSKANTQLHQARYQDYYKRLKRSVRPDFFKPPMIPSMV